MFNLTKSKLRENLLAYYFANQKAVHYVRELAEVLDVDPTNLSRELISLEKQGIFISKTQGRQKYFQLDTSSPSFKELKKIILRIVGVENELKKAFEFFKKIDLAILYGSFANKTNDAKSDIDILVVGDISLENISETIDILEKKFQREVNVKIFSKKEFINNKNKNPLLKSVLSNKHIILIGKL